MRMPPACDARKQHASHRQLTSAYRFVQCAPRLRNRGARNPGNRRATPATGTQPRQPRILQKGRNDFYTHTALTLQVPLSLERLTNPPGQGPSEGGALASALRPKKSPGDDSSPGLFVFLIEEFASWAFNRPLEKGAWRTRYGLAISSTKPCTSATTWPNDRSPTALSPPCRPCMHRGRPVASRMSGPCAKWQLYLPFTCLNSEESS